MSVLEMLKSGAGFLFTLDSAQTITYRLDSSTFDENTLQRIESHIDVSVQAHETTPALEEIGVRGQTAFEEVVVEADDRVFLVNGVQIVGFSPKLRDRIIRGSENWEIYDIKFDPSKSLYRMFARKV